jgi:hypothetical protein
LLLRRQVVDFAGWKRIQAREALEVIRAAVGLPATEVVTLVVTLVGPASRDNCWVNPRRSWWRRRTCWRRLPQRMPIEARQSRNGGTHGPRHAIKNSGPAQAIPTLSRADGRSQGPSVPSSRTL